MARPSIVPIALTIDDRTGYTLWAPPWDEDGEEWQAFLGSTADGVARVHLFPSPAALAAFCRTARDHDLVDHPVWPVVVGLGAADLTPDDDHRYDLDAVYDIAAENPDRWAVEELAATLDIVGRLAECLDVEDDEDDEDDPAPRTAAAAPAADADADAAPVEDDDEDEDDGEFEALAELMSRPETALLSLGIEAFLGRAGEEAWIRLGTALDELWEDVLEELSDHLDLTDAAGVELGAYPSAAEEAERDDDPEELDDEDDDAPSAVSAPAATRPPTSAPAAVAGGLGSGSRVTATTAEVSAAAEFWEGVGILPVEVVVPEGAGLTLRCYVDDEARFLGRDGEVFLFATPEDLSRFVDGDEQHDLSDIASWVEVVATDARPLPADQDRYDLVGFGDVLQEVADGAAGLVPLEALLQPVEGVRDLAEYAGLDRVEPLLAPSTPLGQALTRAEQSPQATLTAADAAVLAPAWRTLTTEVGSALVFRD
ncbi:hypothetical protein GB931_20665 [Modestobacter sp. I12A-02628]|uniref:Primosomal protein n=1 Tax=Goekera deserti TaxID=2497753 RepID=A0A7K3W8J7_9ACTN|nr:hypothetical protein [Goekera deserti]MPR00286.1 hypothetical protein [Goekera deserti]NDI49460.1 hypothetical protein [Goekera deserti]NEL52666.1 hypothetical protein [Goekera deserti]